VFIEFFAEQAQRGGRLGLHHDGLIVHFHDGNLPNGRTSVSIETRLRNMNHFRRNRNHSITPERWCGLTLSGDIHGGGQLSLDFVHRGLNLGGPMGVPYIRGLYENGGAQLYMNRGIGITGFPIRLGARPEITVLELVRT
jgi:hypothetical protein